MADTPDNSGDQTQSELFSYLLGGVTSELEGLGKNAVDAARVLGEIGGQDITNDIKSLVAPLAVLAAEYATIRIASAPVEAFASVIEKIEGLARGTVETGDMISRVTGLTAASFESLKVGADSALGSFARGAYDITNALADSKTEYINTAGEIISADTLLFAKREEFSENYTDALLNDTRLYKFAADEIGKGNTKLVEDNTFAMKALRLDAREVNLIFQNELSETGKITGEALDKYTRAVAATVKVTGLSAEKVAGTMIDIMRDFNTFGDITEARAASLTVTLNNLGLNITDLSSVVGKFQSFDAATQAMSNFSAMTGATLDTLELFRLANEDPEAFVVDLREQLQAQGIQFEELNLIQQKQIASAFGLDPRVMQRLMNENIESITGAKYDLDSRIQDTGAEDARRFLASTADMVKASEENVKTLLEEKTQAAAASLEIQKSIQSSGETVIAVNERIIKNLGGVRDAAIKAQQEVRKALDNVKLKVVNVVQEPAAPAGDTSQPALPAGGAIAAPPTAPPVASPAPPVAPPAPAAAAPAAPAATPPTPAPPTSPPTEASTAPVQTTVVLHFSGEMSALASALTPHIGKNLASASGFDNGSGENVRVVTESIG